MPRTGSKAQRVNTSSGQRSRGLASSTACGSPKAQKSNSASSSTLASSVTSPASSGGGSPKATHATASITGVSPARAMARETCR
ncbi:MAG: hypothetical protein CL960_01405 [Euryarchaeota archaeon]|nr:hypothetical protein [Euryarchaeota archaeon]